MSRWSTATDAEKPGAAASESRRKSLKEGFEGIRSLAGQDSLFGRAAFHSECSFEIETCFAVIGQNARQIAKLSNRLVQSTVGNQGQRQIVVTQDRGRIDRQRLPTIRKCFLELACLKAQCSEIYVSPDLVRINFDGPEKIAFRGRIFMALEQSHAEIGM